MSSAIEIVAAAPRNSGSGEGPRWALDWPRPTESVDAREMRFQGWIISPSVEPIGVEILSDDGTLARAPLGQPRPDLAEAFPDIPIAGKAGFSKTINMLALRSVLTLRVRAVFADQTRDDLATVEVRPGKAEGDDDPPPLVTIVIPCFNQAHFLGDAIESVLAQTHSEIEVVVVDDGSRDNTVEVARRYPGVRYVREENQGLAAARNTGLAQVDADFVVFLDSDDRLMPEAIETGLRELEAEPDAMMAAGVWRLIGEDGQVLTSSPPEQPENVYSALLESCFISTPAAVIYRRELFTEIGGFDSKVSASADYDLYLRTASRYPVHLHPTVVAEYRRHGANMTRNSELIIRSELQVLRRQSRRVKDVPLLNAALERGIERSRAYHGARLVDEIRRRVDEGRRRDAVRTAVALGHHHPAAVPEAIRALARGGLR
jgi:glycosyltransferase involved in cell wall biosynthesis